MPGEPEQEIFLVAYDESWPQRFAEEAGILQRAIGKWLSGPIEHIGSTAIPGMIAKPVIDIMAGVETLDASRDVIADAADIGYCYFPYRRDVMHWFCKPSPAFRTHHLHLVPVHSKLWNERLAFRDYLRTHPGAAAEYTELKQNLAKLHRFDREAYTDGKTPFVERILEFR